MSNQTQNPASDSWDQRIQLAAQYMGISVIEVETCLASETIGVEKEPFGMESLNEEIIRFSDFSKVFADNQKVKIGRVRLAYNALTKGQSSKTSLVKDSVDPDLAFLKENFGYDIKLDDISNEQLISMYEPNKLQHPVTRVLKKRYGAKRVIVLDPETGKIDIDATLELMSDADRNILVGGVSGGEPYSLNGVLVRPLAIGEEPVMIVDEDPMFSGHPLRKNYSTQNHVNWKDVGIPERQFCRIVVNRGEINAKEKLSVSRLLELARNGVLAMGEVFPEAYLEYRERKSDDSLPKLKIDLKKVWDKVQNPFNIGKNRSF